MKSLIPQRCEEEFPRRERKIQGSYNAKRKQLRLELVLSLGDRAGCVVEINVTKVDQFRALPGLRNISYTCRMPKHNKRQIRPRCSFMFCSNDYALVHENR